MSTQQEDTSFVELRCPSCQHMLEPPEGIFDRQIICPACHRAAKLRRIDRMPEGTTPLNPGFTFADLLVAPCNRFAFEMASLVAREPGRKYNPLVIHGGDGSGRTHMMHAIGHHVIQSNPLARVLYTTSEKFINEFIDSLRFEKMNQFRNKYRNLDCLLIDDIQFLVNKESSQEEFFYTFNTLYDSRKQIVISSDRPPKEIPTLQERRFGQPLDRCQGAERKQGSCG